MSNEINFRFGADMRYSGQQNEVTVWFDHDPRDAREATWLREAFERAYERLYSLRLSAVEAEIVSWRLVATGQVTARDSTPDLPVSPGVPKGKRRARFGSRDIETPVYARHDLARGQIVGGPAIIEERETTIVILPGWRAKVHPTGCIMASKE